MSLPDVATAPPWWERIGYEPTNKEMASWLDHTSDANREQWFELRRADADQAATCWQQAHQARLHQLERDLQAARERISFLEANYAGESA